MAAAAGAGSGAGSPGPPGAVGLTTPLLTDAAGAKIGKSVGNAGANRPSMRN